MSQEESQSEEGESVAGDRGDPVGKVEDSPGESSTQGGPAEKCPEKALPFPQEPVIGH
jgi:hypothetical protein